MSYSSSAMQMDAHHLKISLDCNYWYLKVQQLSFICICIMHDDEGRYANACTWSQVKQTWCPAAERGCRLASSVGKVKGFSCWLSDFTHFTCMFDKAHRQKKKAELKMNTTHRAVLVHYLQMYLFIFWFPFLNTPSFVFQIQILSQAPVSGRWPLWSSQHSTTPDPDASLAHGHGGEKHSERENRRERCCTSPAAVYCSVHQWSCLAFIYQIQQSATWPPHKTAHLSLLSLSSLSPSLHLSSLDLKADKNAREDTHTHTYLHIHIS